MAAKYTGGRVTYGGRVAFIGGGNMAQSLAGGLIAAGWPAPALAIADPDPMQRDRLARFAPAAITADNAMAVTGAQLVVLAVKPQAAAQALAEVAEVLRRERPLLLSIAAGLRLAAIESAVGAELAAVRAMPNMAALVGRGASAFFANARVDAAGRALVREVLEAVGMTVEVDEETLLDAVTAVSGSGPAYFFLLVETLAEAGVAAGLRRETALTLASATGAGAMALLATSGETPAALRKRVTSPGGTTAAALGEFDRGDFAGLVQRAVLCAAQRARELGGG
ncbi:MAG: pyrroline-5-carboxylate reductase [Gammaproteobacteria bacterium]